MIEHRFKDGQEVKELWWPDESNISVNHEMCDKITVVKEHGQMAMVDWFAVWKDGKIVQKHNGALISTVIL